MSKTKTATTGRRAGTGKYIPCVGNDARPPLHGMPVFLELFPMVNGGYFTICGVCGTRTFFNNPLILNGAFSPEVIRDAVQPGMARPVNGQGQMI